MIKPRHKIKFILPPKGSLHPNGPSDPLSYYYRPIVGHLYKKRIQKGLNLLNLSYDSILEFGYGSGILLPTLASISNNLFALDTDSDADYVKKEITKLNIKAELNQTDITQIRYPDNFFDLIVSFSVFEHIKNSDCVLKEMFRILKPGGELLVGMPRVDRLMEKLFTLIGFNKINEHHVTDYRAFLNCGKKYFKMIKYAKFPAFLPTYFCLYHNILFIKELKTHDK